MSPEEVFNNLDGKQAGYVEVGTIAQFIDSTLKTKFEEREKYALVNYLDLDRRGTIDRKSFLERLKKAPEINIDPAKSRTVLFTNDKKVFGGSKPAVVSTTLDNEPITDSFRFSDVGKGDQVATHSGSIEKASAITQPLPSKPSQPELQSQSSKISHTDAEIDCIEIGQLSLDDIIRSLSAKYGNILVPKDIPTTIKVIDISKKDKVDICELRNVVSCYK